MNTYWINMNRLRLLIGVLLGLTGCQEKIEEPIDEKPQILSMSIEGIPQQNIFIDQQQQRITVILPAALPALTLAPDFTLSRQAYLTDPVTINLTNYCACWYGGRTPEGMAVGVRIVNKRQINNYSIQLKSGGPLRIKPLTAPVVYDTKTNNVVYFPVENYYGSAAIHFIAVTPTGSARPNWIGGDVCFDLCEGRLNEWGTPLEGYFVGPAEHPSSSLKPGLHDLDLFLADETIVHATGAILVK